MNLDFYKSNAYCSISIYTILNLTLMLFYVYVKATSIDVLPSTYKPCAV